MSHNGWMTHDHIHVYLAVLDRNYESNCWKRSSILPYNLVTLCNGTISAYVHFQRNKSIFEAQLNIIQAARSNIYNWVDTFKDKDGGFESFKILKFIFHPFNVEQMHYNLLVAVNPGAP